MSRALSDSRTVEGGACWDGRSSGHVFEGRISPYPLSVTSLCFPVSVKWTDRHASSIFCITLAPQNKVSQHTLKYPKLWVTEILPSLNYFDCFSQCSKLWLIQKCSFFTEKNITDIKLGIFVLYKSKNVTRRRNDLIKIS